MDDFLNRLLFALIGITIMSLAVTTNARAQSCTVSLPTIAFGTNVDVLPGAAVDITGTVTVTCSGGSGGGQRLCISIGAVSASDGTSRKLTGPSSNTLRYDLYKDSGRTTLWGSWHTGFDTSGVQVDVARGSTTNVTVYARIFGSQQTTVPGAYSSTFTNDPFLQYIDKGGASACPTGGSSATTSSSVTATVISSCNISATNIVFGPSGVLKNNTDAQGTISAQCSSTLPYTLSLNGGNSGAVNPTQRKMTLGGGNVTYGLYQDSGRSQPWGDTIGSNTASGTGNGASQNYTVYGRIPAQTTPAPGTYTDSIIVTVTY